MGAEDWGEVLLRPSRRTGGTAKKAHTRVTQRQLKAFSTAAQALERLRDHRLASLRYTHQMVFDEETSVNVIENDCICNAWNQLEYKF